jgi:hypothetical protein
MENYIITFEDGTHFFANINSFKKKYLRKILK